MGYVRRQHRSSSAGSRSHRFYERSPSGNLWISRCHGFSADAGPTIMRSSSHGRETFDPRHEREAREERHGRHQENHGPPRRDPHRSADPPHPQTNGASATATIASRRSTRTSTRERAGDVLVRDAISSPPSGGKMARRIRGARPHRESPEDGAREQRPPAESRALERGSRFARADVVGIKRAAPAPPLPESGALPARATAGRRDAE